MTEQLPPLPSNSVLRNALCWWADGIIQQAQSLGIQHRAEKVLKEVWRFQDVVPWTDCGVTTAEPTPEDLETLKEWVSAIVRSYSNFYTWYAMPELDSLIMPLGKTEDTEAPPWTEAIKSRKW